MEPREFAVEVPETGGETGNLRPKPLEFFRPFDRRSEQWIDRSETLADTALGDLEDLLLGPVSASSSSTTSN